MRLGAAEPRIISFLSGACAASFHMISKEVYEDLHSWCNTICQPALSGQRLKAALRVLSRETRYKPFISCEPSNWKMFKTIAMQLEKHVLECSEIESASRQCLGQGMRPSSPGLLPDVSVAKEFSALLLDANISLRFIAAKIMGVLGPAAVPYAADVATCLRCDVSSDVRRSAVEALGLLGPRVAAQSASVVSALRDPCPHVCAQAVQTLPRLGVSEASRSVELLSDPNKFVRNRVFVRSGTTGSQSCPTSSCCGCTP